jgi:hypothetical protein
LEVILNKGENRPYAPTNKIFMNDVRYAGVKLEAEDFERKSFISFINHQMNPAFKAPDNFYHMYS